MNKVILMGRLTADPDLKTTPSGTSVTSFSLAIDRKYAKQGEERKTDFINIVAWRQRAEFICKYFSKGQLIALDGSIETRSYVDKNGNNRTAFEVVVENAYFTGDKRSSQQSGNENAYSSYTDDYSEMPIDGDLPFG